MPTKTVARSIVRCFNCTQLVILGAAYRMIACPKITKYIIVFGPNGMFHEVIQDFFDGQFFGLSFKTS